MFCKNCGNEIKEDSKFCDKCGQSVESPNNISNSSPTKNKQKKKLSISTIILIIFISFGVLGAFISTTVPTSTNISNPTSSQEKITNEKKYIGLNETITGKDVEISIDSIQFSQDVQPPVKNTFYTHYQVEDSSNTYLYMILNCKNISTIDLSASSIANITAKYNNNYTYSSFSTIPDDTLGFTYSNLTNIKPLMSQKIYYLIEMPKSIADETDTPIDVDIKIDNQTYIYKYR